ncbi:MAG: hypothetical protein ABI818_17105 [Acidobacteriota bacterium]
MKILVSICGGILVAFAYVVGAAEPAQSSAGPRALPPRFQTSDRCIACHNGLVTPSGEDVSIGFDWRATLMANSARDPYWQASVRRETIDHAEASAAIEDTCATCHMPIARSTAKARGERGQVFAHLPFPAHTDHAREAEDGVSCSLCHQVGTARLGTPESFTGGFVIEPRDAQGNTREYGPYAVDAGHTRVMKSSTEGFVPVQSDHIRQSELCATCHTLITETLGAGGKPAGRLPEQVPYQEWLHSDYKDTKSCQSCHMPVVKEAVPVTRVFGEPRELARHVFVAANFFVQRMLNRYREELDVAALPQELTTAADRTERYLATEAARLSIGEVRIDGGRLTTEVAIENLGGHKLPTAYPSRRAWVHFVVRDRNHRVVFESGAVNPDGSISGNDNDADQAAFEPHYAEIRSADHVQIYESVLGDVSGGVTTGLLSGSQYLKDNRLLPHGFDKRTAEPDIAVHGAALEDPDFTGGGDRVRYSVPLQSAEGPFEVEAELLYQPIGYRWAQNLKAYNGAAEPKRFTTYYDSMAAASTATLARARR